MHFFTTITRATSGEKVVDNWMIMEFKRRSSQSTLQRWFFRLIIVILTIDLVTIVFFHFVVLEHEEAEFYPSNSRDSDINKLKVGSLHQSRGANNSFGRRNNSYTQISKEVEQLSKITTEQRLHRNEVEVNPHDVTIEEHYMKRMDEHNKKDCIEIFDKVIEGQGYSSSSTQTIGYRVIPHKIHIILPPKLSKKCVSEEIHTKILKWHLANHSIYIHDLQSIRRILLSAEQIGGFDVAPSSLTQKMKYKNNFLSQFYHGSTLFQSWADPSTNDHYSANITKLVFDPRKIQYPCGSTVSKWQEQNGANNHLREDESKHPHESFLNDFAKLLVLWEYGGLVISDVESYEPSDFLLEVLEEEQELVRNPHLPKKKRRKIQQNQTELFTTNTTQFIIETNEQFEYTKEFLASIPQHPLVHHLLTETVQRYQKYLFNTTTSSSWDKVQYMTTYHDSDYWNNDVYKFYTTKFYTHKFRKPTQISPPNINWWKYLFEMMKNTTQNKSSLTAQLGYGSNGVDGVPTITILDRDKFNGRSMIKKVNASIPSVQDSSNKYPYDHNSPASSCINNFEHIESNITSLLQIVIPSPLHKDKKASCPNQLYYIEHKIDPIVNAMNKNTPQTHFSRIPQIIHITGKTNCLSRKFYDSIQEWYAIPDHAVLYHDDNAVKRLFDSQDWEIFPQLKQAIKCVSAGAGLADVWRYLLMWEYGGIYTDVDNAPGPNFVVNGASSSTVISDDMDALFEIEKEGFPSQYFFAVRPHHPVMYFAVQNAIDRLLDVNDVHSQKVPFVTGPGALKAAVVSFKYVFAT